MSGPVTDGAEIAGNVGVPLMQHQMEARQDEVATPFPHDAGDNAALDRDTKRRAKRGNGVDGGREARDTARARKSGDSWSWGCGKKNFNRVRVYQRSVSPTLYIEWYDGPTRRQVSLGTLLGRKDVSREDAIRAAQVKSMEIARVQAGLALSPPLAMAEGTVAMVRDAVLVPKGALLAHRIPVTPICGVYVLLSGDTVVYVGQSTDVAYRLWQHRVNPPAIFATASVIPVPAPLLDRVEALLIHRFSPIGNRRLPVLNEIDEPLLRAMQTMDAEDVWESLSNMDSAGGTP